MEAEHLVTEVIRRFYSLSYNSLDYNFLEAAVFVDRHKELTFLNSLLTRKHPGPAQMILMYGRRRVMNDTRDALFR